MFHAIMTILSSQNSLNKKGYRKVYRQVYKNYIKRSHL